MTDNIWASWIVWLFWIECAIFGLGSTAGPFLPPVARALGLDENRAKNWAMRLALALAFFGGLMTVGASGWYLATFAGRGEDCNCKIATTIWSGIDIVGISTFPRFALTLYVDALSALFGLLIGFFTACVAWYSFSWLDRNPRRHSVAGAFGLFAFSTLLVVLVNNGFWLLLVLELMSLSFGYLVLYRGQQGGMQEESKTAIRTYLIVSHVSTICLAIAILIIGNNPRSPSLDFELFRQYRDSLPPLSRDVAFVFALIGLGMRAGMTPFHFWVPVAHPQSPTTTHAFSLGVAIKVAIYLMIRFFFEFLSPISWWWGALLLVLAGLTAVLNVFYALLSRDLKRALAYHSVENIGIILVGLGLALLFGSERFGGDVTVRSVAGVALIASLFHVINHAIFKGLLYLGTGCIENRTHTVIMDELGGLIRRYPWTSVMFLVGAIAIAGFPPFNGFISEWLTLQSFFAGIDVYRARDLTPVLMLVLPVTLIMLGLAFALTALAFVKIAGETLLGLPRNPKIVAGFKPGDAPVSMRFVLFVLAALCLVLGLFPSLLIPWLAAAVNGIGYDTRALRADLFDLTIAIQKSSGESIYLTSLAMLPIGMLVVGPVATILAAFVWRRFRPARSSPVWVGGEPYQPQTMQYTGSALSALVWETFQKHAAARRFEEPLPTVFALAEGRYVMEQINRGYNAGIAMVLRASTWVGEHLQNGDIRMYLLYIFGAFITVLLVLAVAR